MVRTFAKFVFFGAVIFFVVYSGSMILWATGIVGPDASVTHGDDMVASSVCGIMYTTDHNATRADFQMLLQETKKACDEPVGTETSWRNQDGSLKHATIIGDEDIISTPGTPFDCCIINWELTPVAAFAAFEDVCLNRHF